MMLVTTMLLLAVPQATERRCGWLHNPTPGNWSLVDRDREWLLSSQGGFSAPGWDDLPVTAFEPREQVKTNGSYGYSCACADVVVDRASGDVRRIAGLQPKPLKQCKADRRLPRP